MEPVIEKRNSRIFRVIIGASREEGGTRTSVVKLGGQNILPFYLFEGDAPHPPVLAGEIYDKPLLDCSPLLKEIFGEVWHNPGKWAIKWVENFGAEAICLRLISAHPDDENTGPETAVERVKQVLEAVGVPLIVKGPGFAAKDNEVLTAISRETRGERLLLGSATPENYKILVQSALENGHCLIAESPIDINIAKQANILLNDQGFPLERMVMDPTTGGLGYGLEYTYSIMERARLAALQGDRTLALPFISFIGHESWRSKEAKSELIELGDFKTRAINWEAAGAVSLLLAGVDLLVMHHPQAVNIVRRAIRELSENKTGA